MSQRNFRIGTRGSRLALRQTEIALQSLRRACRSDSQAHPDARFEVRPIRTAGDKQARASLSEIGGRGVFVAELERALLGGDIDIAVHSLKDLPSEDTDGLLIAAVCQREDARDVLVSREGRRLAELPVGASVGTGSPRRAVQVRAARPDLRLVDIRGNVETRIRKVQAGEVDAVILAAAGLARLGWLDRASEVIPLEVVLPAVGQGALALQVRADDADAVDLVRASDHPPTRWATAAERAFLRHLGGGCQAAIAAFAVVEGERLRLRGLAADVAADHILRGEIEGAAAEAEALGVALARSLLGRGAAALLATGTAGEAARLRRKGMVWLVGAGPGDPGLITVAGLECLRQADVVVYDRLVSPQLLAPARPGAERIFVGKPSGPVIEAGEQALDQEAINRLLIARARAGKRVVRLKGGDPFVFGRGGEEALALRAAGVPFTVVPGVTSATAVPAYAGIPVTHRGLASSFAVVTGHEASPERSRRDPRKGESALRWDRLATAVDTVVLLMGARTLPAIVDKLIAHGRPPDTPVAVVQWGTTPQQRTVTGTLADIAQRVAQAGLAPPTVAVVGDVVRLGDALAWYPDLSGRSLFGKRVLITRTRRQAGALARLLALEGALPIELPAIEIRPTEEGDRLAGAIERLAAGGYQWAVFTSANAVELFFDALRKTNRDARAFASARVAAIGPATAEALSERGIVADVVPGEFIAEGVVEALRVGAHGRAPLQSGARVLLPRAESARPELVQGLQSLGAAVDEAILYRAAAPSSPDAEALAQLRDGGIDVVTFTSSSTVRNLAAMLDGNLECLRKPLVACIGPVTARTAEELGLRVGVMAAEHTVPGLVAAVREHFSKDGDAS